MRRLAVCVSMSTLFAVPAAESAQGLRVIRSESSEQTDLALTVYSNGRAMIRDRRKISFEKGKSALEIQDVSGKMRAETARFRVPEAAGDVVVLEQNLESDLISPQNILEKFLGKKITLIKTHPTNGTESFETAEVLAVKDGVVLKTKDRIETGLSGRFAFPELPAGLRSEPTLSLVIDSKKRGEQEVELDYLSDGVTWRADYIAELNAEENSTHLTGLVTLNNQSGTSFRNAQLQLIAGDVRVVGDKFARNRSAKVYTQAMAMDSYSASETPAAAAADSFFEYHMYSIPRRTNVLSNQTKQITLLQSPEVESRKEIVFTSSGHNYFSAEQDFSEASDEDGESGPDAPELGVPVAGGVFLVFENDKDSKIGLPLPEGIVRVYKKDKSGVSQFIGEDKVKHTPEGERVRIRLGRSFDVSARRKMTSFKNLPSVGWMKKTIRQTESGFRITFKNAKATAQNLNYREVLGGEWKIVAENRKHRKLSQDTAEWQMTVPARGQLTLDFRVQVALRR
ncbi:MAG: DUF4139 domain-containing protein [Proteobacteria bacterium]|nr:DUF4139 domain-containing protein [Pseudomonadota bacterium]